MSARSEELLTEQYDKTRKFFCLIWILFVPGRLILSLVCLCDFKYSENHIAILMIFTFIIIIQYRCSNPSYLIKKTITIFQMQFGLFTLKYMSMNTNSREETITCILSTILMLLNGTCVFNSKIWVLFVTIEHILVWLNYNIQDFLLLLFFGFNKHSYSVIVPVSITILSSLYFDKVNKKPFYQDPGTGQQFKLTFDHINILKAFPDGLLIINSALGLEFQNDLIKEILGESPVSSLESTKSLYSEAPIISLVKDFICKNNKPESSLGVSLINSKQYEFRIHKLTWENKQSFMLTVKNVSSILDLERISAENRTKKLIIRSISHEFRTPINCIDLILDEIYTKVRMDIQEKLTHIKTCSKLLNFQINDIMDYSDLTDSGLIVYKSETNLKEDLKKCIEVIKFQADYKKIKVLCKIDSLIPDSVITDSYRVQKVVVNLLINALKYTSHGRVELYAINKGKSVVVRIKDSGIGIPEERKKQIFSVLKDENKSGLGCLGLHICQNILKKLDSRLKVKSTIGDGTEFYFKLPLPSFSLTKDSKTPKSVSFENLLEEDMDIPCESVSCSDMRQINFKHLRSSFPQVLIVDDNDFNRMCLANLLKNEGIDFEEAVNGQAAVNKIIEYDKLNEPIKCVIMDLNMPVMDGWSASRLVSQLFSQGKISSFPAVIAHTAYSSDDDIRKCYEAGMVVYMPKPSTRDRILTIIRKYVS